MRLLILTLLLTGCNYKQSPEAIITPSECKRMCKPSNVEAIDALEGTCSCNKKPTKRR